jgi:protocatechuate 3,4-dioxygenase beta subunit
MSMILRQDKLKMSHNTTKFIIIVIMLSLTLILIYPNFINLPDSFAQSTTTTIGANDTISLSSSTTRPPSSPPTSLLPPLPASPELSATQKSASTNKTCTVKFSSSSTTKLKGTPQQTEGPYFVDDMPNRSDIRSDPSDGSVQQGIPLTLVLYVYNVDNGSCIPIKGARVDIWHASSQGVYSGVSDQGTAAKKFLRGYQVTDNNGTVRFITIYPGWYQGRTIHIHDKVRTFNGSEKTLEWTSQLYFNNSINQQVHTQPPYTNHGPPPMSNEQDEIYTGASTDDMIPRNSGEHLMLHLTKEGQSYLGTFNIVLNSSESSNK